MRYNFTNKKDKKIMIYKTDTAKDADGFGSTTYIPVFDRKIWAAYRFLSGDWNQIQAAMYASEVCTFSVNWNDKIQVGMKVLYDNELYTITRIDDFEGYKKDIKLYCEKVLNWSKNEFPAIV